jgi:hypothetical protein
MIKKEKEKIMNIVKREKRENDNAGEVTRCHHTLHPPLPAHPLWMAPKHVGTAIISVNFLNQ